MKRKPEVMSPAGHWPQLHAAIEAGADSVYFGLSHFTARAKAGFTLAELPEALRTLHRRGARGFVTFNTLVFDHELDAAAETLTRIAEAGADAIIVQDLGALRIARQVAPDLEIHASTQMSITDAAGARFAAELGAERVTLARELSLPEIEAIAQASPVELEVFVHGALCVAYSGQCFSSEAWGGRSANRGQCAQACRLPYELYVDSVHRPLDDARYLLSPGDLYALRQVPELARIGVAALKIEGRYKEAEYVAAATRAYRQAVDEAWSGRPLTITPREELELVQVYSRGLGPSFISGTNHQAVVQGRAPRHRGVLMGRVLKVTPDAIQVEPSEAHALSPLKPGDGLVFDAADWRSPEEPEEGGRVYSVTAAGKGKVELRFGNHALRPERIRPGDLVWRTQDPAVEKALREVTQAREPKRRQGVRVEAAARPGEPLRTVWRVGSHQVAVDSEGPLTEALNQGLDSARLEQQLGRLGGTPYVLESFDFRIEGNPFAPASLLNQIRRDAVEKLQDLQGRPAAPRTHPFTRPAEPARDPLPDAAPQLHVLVRSSEQLNAALELRPASITLDYLDLYGLKPSVNQVRAAGIPVRAATPRILKPGEERILDFLLRLDCPLLIRPIGLLHALRERSHPPLTGDFSLNAANVLSARELLELGLDRITPTHDLNAEQIAHLARAAGAARIEAILYQHLPVFHTEHCVFCRFLSTGTSYRDCGRPCEKHQLELKDSSGRRHPVIADVGCRNTVFGAEAQEASAHLDAWLDAGIRHFRIEAAHESGSQLSRVIRAYQQALEQPAARATLGATIRKLAPQGSTQGSLFVPLDHLTRPMVR